MSGRDVLDVPLVVGAGDQSDVPLLSRRQVHIVAPVVQPHWYAARVFVNG